MPLTELYDKARQQWPDTRISRVELERPKDSAPTIELTRADSESAAATEGINVVLNAQTGAVLRTPRAIPVPMLIGGGFYGLHMGHFAGPLLRWLYFFGGIGGTVLIGTGLISELFGWIVRDQSFLPNSQRLVPMILQVSILGLLPIGATQVVTTTGIELSSGPVLAPSA
ncbi:hypothetical protein EWW49_27830, partial [Pseudomonas syringae]